MDPEIKAEHEFTEPLFTNPFKGENPNDPIPLRIPKKPWIINFLYFVALLTTLTTLPLLFSPLNNNVEVVLACMGLFFAIQLTFFAELLRQIYCINQNTFRQYEGFRYTMEERQRQTSSFFEWDASRSKKASDNPDKDPEAKKGLFHSLDRETKILLIGVLSLLFIFMILMIMM